MTRIVGVVNLKGGVGKTTTTVNLGAALALYGLKVLLIDLDPQKSLSGWSGVENHHTTGDILLDKAEIVESIVKWEKTGCWILPAGNNLRAVEDQLLTFNNREYILREKLKALDEYDYILIDSSPSYGLLTINTICASHEIIIPLQTEILALESTIPFFETLGDIKRKFHPDLKIAGILPNMFDTRTNLSKSILDQMKASEYLGPLMFKTCIRKSVKLAETPSLGCAITRYSSTYGTEDFKALAEEMLTDSDRAKIDLSQEELFNTTDSIDKESQNHVYITDDDI